MTMYQTMKPQWEYVDDCYKGVIEIKSPQKVETYLPKFPVEARNDAKNPQYKLRSWAADYDNIFKSAIMSMVGVMGNIPAKIEFGSVDQAVRDLDVWGNEDDDRLIGLKARLNHAQTLFGRYGLWLDVIKWIVGAVLYPGTASRTIPNAAGTGTHPCPPILPTLSLPSRALPVLQ
jgi:hypothetical protein